MLRITFAVTVCATAGGAVDVLRGGLLPFSGTEAGMAVDVHNPDADAVRVGVAAVRCCAGGDLSDCDERIDLAGVTDGGLPVEVRVPARGSVQVVVPVAARDLAAAGDGYCEFAVTQREPAQPPTTAVVPFTQMELAARTTANSTVGAFVVHRPDTAVGLSSVSAQSSLLRLELVQATQLVPTTPGAMWAAGVPRSATAPPPRSDDECRAVYGARRAYSKRLRACVDTPTRPGALLAPTAAGGPRPPPAAGAVLGGDAAATFDALLRAGGAGVHPAFVAPFACGAGGTWNATARACSGCAGAGCALPGCQCAVADGIVCGRHGGFSREYQACVCDAGYESSADAAGRNEYCDVRRRVVEAVPEADEGEGGFGLSFGAVGWLFDVNPARFLMVLGLVVLWVATCVLFGGEATRARAVLALLNAQRELSVIDSAAYFHLAEDYGVDDLVDPALLRAAATRTAFTSSWFGQSRAQAPAEWMQGPKQAPLPPLFSADDLRGDGVSSSSGGGALARAMDELTNPDSEVCAAVQTFHERVRDPPRGPVAVDFSTPESEPLAARGDASAARPVHSTLQSSSSSADAATPHPLPSDVRSAPAPARPTATGTGPALDTLPFGLPSVALAAHPHPSGSHAPRPMPSQPPSSIVSIHDHSTLASSPPPSAALPNPHSTTAYPYAHHSVLPPAEDPFMATAAERTTRTTQLTKTASSLGFV